MLHEFVVLVDVRHVFIRASQKALVSGFMEEFRKFKSERKDIEFTWEQSGPEPRSWKTSRLHLEVINRWLYYWESIEVSARTMSTQVSCTGFSGPFFPCVDCIGPTIQVCTSCGKEWQVLNSVAEHPLLPAGNEDEGIIVRQVKNWRRRRRE